MLPGWLHYGLALVGSGLPRAVGAWAQATYWWLRESIYARHHHRL